MPWTWAQIRDEWCFGGAVAGNSEEIVAAFERVESHMGLEWLTGQRPKPTHIVLQGELCARILALARQLEALRCALGLETVLAKLRAGETSAWSELIAADLCCGGDPELVVEFAVPVVVGKRNRIPDFRLCKPGEPWVWVEVSAPDQSEAAAEVVRVMKTFAPLRQAIPFGRAAEIFIRRDLTPAEIEVISQEFTALLAQTPPARRDLEGLALLLYGHCEPGTMVLEDHGEPRVPRLGNVSFDMVDGRRRDLSVRHAFTDARAKKFLTREASQLPKNEPGLVMLKSASIWGANPPWISMIQDLLRPSQHTRVSAVALFAPRIAREGAGLTASNAARLVVNPHADCPLPEWLLTRLQAAHP